MPPISKYLFPLANVCLTFVMFPPIDSSFNVSQGQSTFSSVCTILTPNKVGGEYEYQHLLHAECSLSKPLNSLFVQRLADIHCDYVSSSSSSPPPSTPLLSPTTTSSSSFDSPFGSPTSFSGNNVSTSPDSRSTSPDSPSTPSTAPSILAETTAASGTLASAKDPSHIKRPPNAYMCFRTYFCKNIPHDVERHNATVSKITGMAWNRLSDEERIPYVEQAAVIKAEFMAKHPDWVFKPTPRKEKKKMRRTQTRTLADQQRYMRIAMGFNSGKRGKELKRVAEMTEAAGTEEISTPLAMVRRSRKFTTTKKSSTTPDPVRSVENLSHSADREPQTETHRMSIEFPPSVTTVQVEEMPPSFPQLSLRNEPQSVNAPSRHPHA